MRDETDPQSSAVEVDVDDYVGVIYLSDLSASSCLGEMLKIEDLYV